MSFGGVSALNPTVRIQCSSGPYRRETDQTEFRAHQIINNTSKHHCSLALRNTHTNMWRVTSNGLIQGMRALVGLFVYEVFQIDYYHLVITSYTHSGALHPSMSPRREASHPPPQHSLYNNETNIHNFIKRNIILAFCTTSIHRFVVCFLYRFVFSRSLINKMLKYYGAVECLNLIGWWTFNYCVNYFQGNAHSSRQVLTALYANITLPNHFSYFKGPL